MTYFLFWVRKGVGTYVYAYGPSGYYPARFVANMLRAWAANNGFTTWTIELWELSDEDWKLVETF